MDTPFRSSLLQSQVEQGLSSETLANGEVSRFLERASLRMSRIVQQTLDAVWQSPQT